jgi:hypothetical protein
MAQHEVRPAEWIATAPIQTSTSVDIVATPAAVWGFLADHGSWPQWFTLLDRVEVTGSPAGVGGTRRVVSQRLPFDEVFTAWDEGQHFAWAVTSSRLPILSVMAESIRLDPTSTGCRLDYTQGLQARRGFGGMLNAMWQRNVPGIQQALNNLRQLAEEASSQP